MFRGAMTALVTPFKGGQIDEAAYRAHISRQIAAGITAVVPCGTTGESATLSHTEHRRVIEIAVSEAKGKAMVLAGTGSNNTAEAVELTKFAKSAGADGALVITPYYNKPTPEGLYLHYKTIAEEAKFPIVAYNVPGRTGTNMTADTVARIAQIPEVRGVKEATGSMQQAGEILARVPSNFAVISGDDFTVLPLLALGGAGVISVVTNLVPGDMVGMIKAFEAGDIAEARRLHFRMLPVCEACFYETNPIPVKTALAMLGRMEPELRLPLCRMSEPNRKRLETVLASHQDFCGLGGSK